MQGIEKVDRLSLVVTAENVEKLLGIPKLEAGTGHKMAEAIHEFLCKWKMDTLIEFVCFDTTSTNTGIYNGSAYLIEQILGRELFFIACRHHMCEIFLKAIFELEFGATSGPEVLIFNRFARNWKNINTKNFKTGIEDNVVRSVISPKERESHKQFCLSKLQAYHSRKDYKELLELSLIFIGENVPDFKQFKQPGATSHARFMAKAIYNYKMFLFRDEFTLTARELKSVRNICIFLTKIYVQYWFGCISAIEAPRRDLQFIKDVIKYHDKKSSAVLLDKMLNHLWYLSEEAVGLAFFDSEVSLAIKRKMVRALNRTEDDELPYLKRLNITIEDLMKFEKKDLSHFVTSKTKRFFIRLNVGLDFLEVDPSLWNDREDYSIGLRTCQHLTVVNDAAERAIKLITDFNRALTCDENDKQFLLQVLEYYRHIFPSHTKTSLMREEN